jgi:hypothetical protein
MSLVAVLARLRGGLARHVGEQGFDVAPALNVELLVDAALSRLPQGNFSGELLAERTVDLDQVSVSGISKVGRCSSCWIFRGRVIRHLVVELEIVGRAKSSTEGRVDRGHCASIGEEIDGGELIDALNRAFFNGISFRD